MVAGYGRCGLLKQKKARSGRIWLILGQLDRAGRGWLAKTDVVAALTDGESELRLYSKRHLRTLLTEGDGLFWQRDEGRIWLRSEAKVLRELDAPRISNRPVRVPSELLLGRIGAFRAALYAVVHSGREGTPISRETLRDSTGASPRTQHGYEKKANVTVRGNVALGSPFNREATHEVAWRRAYLPLHDVGGVYGPAGCTYHAWRLPNSYLGPFPATGRQRNGKDLRHQGEAGNRRRRYLADARQLAKVLRGGAGRGCYWPLGGNRPGVWIPFES